MSTHKFLFLFNKVKKNLFKESRFVFDEPETHPTAETEDPKVKEAKLAKEKEEEEKRKAAERAPEADKNAQAIVKENEQLNEDLKSLDQKKFDKIIKERIKEKGSKGDLEIAQIDKLALFAAANEPEKNVKALFEEFKEQRLHTNQLSAETTKLFIQKLKEGDKKILIDELIKTTATATILIEATADEDFKELLTKFSDSQKADLLNSKIDGPKKQEIFDNLIRAKIFTNGDSATIEKIILYVCKENPGMINTTIFQEFTGSGVESKFAKLTYPAAKALLEITFPKFDTEQQSQSIFNGLLNNLSKELLGKLIGDKNLKFEIRDKLYSKSLPSRVDGISKPVELLKEVTEDGKPAEEAAKTVEKSTEKRRDIETEVPVKGDKKDKKGAVVPAEGTSASSPASTPAQFSEEKDWKAIIEKMAGELEFDGKSISWTFPLKIDGKQVSSERSFRVTKKFLKELNKTDENGRVHNTKDKVKLCAYEWLFKHIYKGDKDAAMKGKVEAFKESQAYLVEQIDALNAKIKAEAEKPGTVEAPKPGAAEAPKPGAAEAPKPGTVEARPAETGGREKAPEKELTLAEKLAEKVQELQSIADEVADKNSDSIGAGKRSIKIEGPKSENESGQIYAIKIDGKETTFVLDIAKKQNDKKEFEFSFKKEIGEKSEYKSYSKEEVTAKFQGILTQSPDERAVQDFDKAILELGKTGYGATIENKEPKALNVTQFTALKDTLSKIKTIIKDGEDLPSILEKLNNLARDTQPIIEKTSIVKITINSDPKMEWNPSNKDAPFGEFSKFEDTIKAIKMAELGGDKSPKFAAFIEQSEKTSTEKDYEKDQADRMKEYRGKYKSLTEKVYKMKFDLYEGEIVKNFKKMSGYKKVSNIMKNPPFFFHETGEVAKKVGEIVSNGLNDRVDFGDVFKAIKDVPALKAKGLTNLMEDPDKFIKTFDRLLSKQNPDKGDQEQLELMFNEVLTPCLDLLKALEQLEFNPDKQKERSELPKETTGILGGLSKLCDFKSREQGGWAKFLGLINGAKGEITMADIDGNTMFVTKDKFHDHYSTKAALTILTNINEDKNNDGEVDHYSFDKSGNKVFNQEAMTKEINDLIQLGVTNMVMAEAGQKGSKIAPGEIVGMIKEKSGKLMIKDFNNLTNEQILAFQLGFIVKQASQFATQVKEAGQIVTESSEDPRIKNNPLLKQVAKQLLEQGLKPSEVKKIQEKLLLAAGASFVKTNDGNYEFEGGAVGVMIPIPDSRLSIMIQMGGTMNGQFIAGIGLNIKVYEGETFKFNVATNLDLKGFTAGANGSVAMGQVDANAFVGVRFGWDSIIPTVGGGVGFSWNRDAQLKSNLEEAKEQTDYAQVWAEWQKMPKSDTDAKFAKLQEIKPVYDKIAPVMAEFKLSKEDVVTMVEEMKEELNRGVIQDMSSRIITYVGFAMVGPVPVPQIGFSIGSVEVTTPNRAEISKILGEISDIKVTKALKEAVKEVDEKLKKGESTPILKEGTSKLVYGRDGKLMSLVKEEEVKMIEVKNNLESYNQSLKRTEMALEKNPNGTMKLKIYGTDRKDVEIHIDPQLKDLAIITDKGQIIIEGNVDKLVISRERFSLPFEETEGSATMRDIITIRSAESLVTNRDRTWIEKYESKFLQKLEDEESFSIQKGNFEKGKQENIRSVDGYSSKKVEEIAKIPEVKDFIAKRVNLDSRIDNATLKELRVLIKERQKALIEGKFSEKQDDFDKMGTRENLFENLEGLFLGKDKLSKAFRKEFTSEIDDPEALVSTLIKFAEQTDTLKDLNEKELNLGLTHLINVHFTNVYKEAADRINKKKKGTKVSENGKEEDSEDLQDLNKKEIQRINGEVLKGMKKKLEFVKEKVFTKSFKNAVNNMEPKPETPVQELIDKLFKDIYEKLKAKLLDPDFDFRTIKVEAIPGGAYLFSGSRLYNEKGKVKGAMSQNIGYETLEKNPKLLLDFGFLEGTTGKYSLESKVQVEKDLARVMLELASPIPKDDAEFLRSPLAMKFAGLQATALLTYDEGSKFDDYKKISEIYKNPELLTEPAYKASLDKYRAVINEIRGTQLDGKTFEKKIGNTGLTVKLKMNTDISYGAYSKCTNTSFYVNEVGEIEISQETMSGGKGLIAKFNTTNEVVSTDVSKIFASVVIGAGFRSERVSSEGSGGKHSEQGVKDKPVDDKSSASGPAPAQPVAGEQQAKVPVQPASQSASPHKH
ncbi:MAG: hypothetical protein NTZ25_04420 [Candidatus Peregrinibacteria bacterium]|nr:hypothetical protein [Candidatus Peregrinibacteria bacterium]